MSQGLGRCQVAKSEELVFSQKADTENSEPAFLRLLTSRSKSRPSLGALLTLALHLSSEVNPIKSGRLSNCDHGWKWGREEIHRDLA